MVFRRSMSFRSLLEPFRPELLVVRCGRRRRIHQDHARHPLRMPKRVFKGKHSTPGVPQQYHGVEVKILSNLFYICDFGCERDVFGLHTIGGPAAPPLIVVDEMERIGQAVQVGHEIAVVEIRSTMEDDDFRTLPELSRIQLCVPNRDMAFTGHGAPLAFKRSRRTRRQPCWVCHRKDREG